MSAPAVSDHANCHTAVLYIMLVYDSVIMPVLYHTCSSPTPTEPCIQTAPRDLQQTEWEQHVQWSSVGLVYDRGTACMMILTVWCTVPVLRSRYFWSIAYADMTWCAVDDPNSSYALS